MRILGRLNSACSYAVVATALLAATAGAAQAGDVRNGRELYNALRTAQPGEVIRLLGGTYQQPPEGPFALRYNANDTASNPVQVVAAVRGQANIVSPLTINARHALLKDLKFDGSNIRVTIAADGVKVTNSVFKLTGTGEGSTLLVKTGDDIRIERNEFVSRAIGVSVEATPDGAEPPAGLKVCRNFFHDFTDGGGNQNDHAAIELGQGSNDRLVRLGALVEENLFQNIRVGREGEVISVKSSYNNVNRNRLVNSRSLVIRHGNENTAAGNRLEGSVAIVIHDAFNKAWNNHAVQSNGIRAMAGDQPYIPTGKNIDHRPAVDAKIAGNDVERIVDGYRPSNNGQVDLSYDERATRTCIASSDLPPRNVVERPFAQGNGGTCSAPATAPAPIQTLGAGDVGPGSGSGCP